MKVAKKVIAILYAIFFTFSLFAESYEKDFWQLLNEKEKIIYARGLLNGLMTDQIISFIILSELDKGSVEYNKLEQDIRTGITNEYRVRNQNIYKLLSESYSVDWQNDLIRYIDKYYMDSQNGKESLSTAFFFFLNDKYSWGYKP